MMKLNPDCVRDILLCVEQVVGFTTRFMYDSAEPPQLLSQYTHEEILYHTKQAYYANLITDFTTYDSGNYFDVEDLSAKGHEFLANIREDNIWNNVKGVAKVIGSASLNTIIAVSSNVMSEIIKSYFATGKNPVSGF